ncbi:hypothetical protein ACFLTK_02420 [Chloroflexota bacterium]
MSDNLLFKFNSLTGKYRRHNIALHDITEWLSTIQELLKEYDLHEEDSNLGTMLENVGKVRLELIRITYRARGITQIARKVKNVKVLPLVNEIIDELEDFGRELINLDFNQSELIKTIPRIRNSLLELKDVISEIEYK